MSRTILARYLNPRKFKREQEQAARVAALRVRDGNACARCRRPMRFDLPTGHDQGPEVEGTAAPDALDALYLTHRRCNASGVDHTGEVQERVRRKNEAELFGNSRKRA
jgi:hypothetical protein